MKQDEIINRIDNLISTIEMYYFEDSVYFPIEVVDEVNDLRKFVGEQ